MDQVFLIDLTCYVLVLLALTNMGREGETDGRFWARHTMFAPRYHILHLLSLTYLPKQNNHNKQKPND